MFNFVDFWYQKLEQNYPKYVRTKPLGLLAQFCNPATGGQGYLDGAGHLGLNTWLGIDLLFHH